jgi:uncharacterized repeat protein (TIGR01451 family)
MIMEYFMQPVTSLSAKVRSKRMRHGFGVSALAVALAASQAGPAWATIDNTASPTGTPASGTLPTPPTATVNVPVAPAGPALTVVKTVKSPNATNITDSNADGIVGVGDTVTFQYVITNSGNVTINAVTPVDTGPRFNTIAGTGTLGAFTLISTTNATSTGAQLLPSESGTWEATYTLTALDSYRAAGILAASGDAVTNSATATGTPVSGTLAAVTPSTAETQIPANPRMSIAKTFTFTTGTSPADVGDVIQYTYTIVNTGNVTINSVGVADTHEGVLLSGEPSDETLITDGPLAPGSTSTDAAADNAVWSVLRPGATVRFRYNHTVTQAEFNNQ